MAYYTTSSPSMHLSCTMAGLELDNSSRFSFSHQQVAEKSNTITTSSPFNASRSITLQQLADAHARTQKALHRASKKAAMKHAMEMIVSQPRHLTPKARREKLKSKAGEKNRKVRCYECAVGIGLLVHFDLLSSGVWSLQDAELGGELELEMEWGIYSSPMARVDARRAKTSRSRRWKGDCMLVDGEYVGGLGVYTPRR